MPAGAFKQGCLALIDDVATSKREIVITKRGKPVARLVPMEDPREREQELLAQWRGKAQQLVYDAELIAPSSEVAHFKSSRRMNTLVLDTHAALGWSFLPDKLGRTARTAPNEAEQLLLPGIIFWEAALHEDPADRFIVATALHARAPLVTKDRTIRCAKLVQVVG